MEIAGLIALFAVNSFLLFPFFGKESQANYFSAPFIPTLADLTSFFVPFEQGVRFWLIGFLLVFPFTFYYFAREVSSRKLVGFVAAFLASLPVGFFLPLRVSLGIFKGDGQNIVSLTIIPWVCLLLLRFLRQGNFKVGLFLVLGIALTALTSPLGLVTLAVFMVATTFSEMLLNHGRLKFMRLTVVLVLAAGFSAFWYNPRFVLLTIFSPEGGEVRRIIGNLIPLSFFLVPVLGVFGFLVFEKKPVLQSMFIAFFLCVGFGLFSFEAGGLYLAPSRFLPAFGVSIAFFVANLAGGLFDFLRTRTKIGRFKINPAYQEKIGLGFIGILFILIVGVIGLYARDFWGLEASSVLGLKAEQKVGIWEMREETSFMEDLSGYVITGLTIFGTVFLRKKLGRENNTN